MDAKGARKKRNRRKKKGPLDDNKATNHPQPSSALWPSTSTPPSSTTSSPSSTTSSTSSSTSPSTSSNSSTTSSSTSNGGLWCELCRKQLAPGMAMGEHEETRAHRSLAWNDRIKANEIRNQQKVMEIKSEVRAELKAKEEEEKRRREEIRRRLQEALEREDLQDDSLFSLLPEEIRMRVFSFLTPTELFGLMLVCKNWFRVMSDPGLWRQACLGNTLEENYHVIFKSTPTPEPKDEPNDFWRKRFVDLSLSFAGRYERSDHIIQGAKGRVRFALHDAKSFVFDVDDYVYHLDLTKAFLKAEDVQVFAKDEFTLNSTKEIMRGSSTVSLVPDHLMVSYKDAVRFYSKQGVLEKEMKGLQQDDIKVVVCSNNLLISASIYNEIKIHNIETGEPIWQAKKEHVNRLTADPLGEDGVSIVVNGKLGRQVVNRNGDVICHSKGAMHLDDRDKTLPAMFVHSHHYTPNRIVFAMENKIEVFDRQYGAKTCEVTRNENATKDFNAGAWRCAAVAPNHGEVLIGTDQDHLLLYSIKEDPVDRRLNKVTTRKGATRSRAIVPTIDHLQVSRDERKVLAVHSTGVSVLYYPSRKVLHFLQLPRYVTTVAAFMYEDGVVVLAEKKVPYHEKDPGILRDGEVMLRVYRFL